ncbi:uncharacterized protein LOC132252114 [Alligator mississippiensis]|uniref:uncharacterized protein LOC132252114 n=1 Tax=Alligator mississippiensis TaxID=8496 RepID=UPI0028775585|nr:uncharacterized protein LOC132252114 [Alligator mississippiensis]
MPSGAWQSPESPTSPDITPGGGWRVQLGADSGVKGKHRRESDPGCRKGNGVFPLREQVVPGPLEDDGEPTYRQTFVHIPFTTSDLYNWRNNTPSLRENPEKVRNLFEMIFKTHNPTWADVQSLLDVLLTPEERRMVVNKSHEYVEKESTAGHLQGNRDDHVPTQEPDWKPDQDMTSIHAYREYILRGLRDAVKKPQNLSNVYEVRQETNETPSAFLERIYTTFEEYTCEDLEDASNAHMLNMIFIGQSTPDIRKNCRRQTEQQDGQMFLTVPPEKGWHLQACLLGLLREESTPDIPQTLLDAVVPWVWASH